jgi:hypothetical protein
MSKGKLAFISQNYFDEVCVENKETFDLDDDAAVQETLTQLGGPEACAYLIHTYPNDNCLNRKKRKTFTDILEKGSDSLELGDLSVIQTCLQDDYGVYSRLIEQHNGIQLLIEACQLCVQNDLGVELWVLQTILSVLRKPHKSLLQTFQSAIRESAKFFDWWLDAFNKHLKLLFDTGEGDALEVIIRLLTIAYWSCKGCEANKNMWMTSRDGPQHSLPQILTNCLQLINESLSVEEDDASNLITLADHTCQFVTVLCTFDDFKSSSDDKPTVSSATSNAHTFLTAGILPHLAGLVARLPTPKVVFCIRSMAIQDDIVQCLIALGVLDCVVRLFNDCVHSDGIQGAAECSDDNVDLDDPDPGLLQTACLGFFRNVCANDEIKCTLCSRLSIVDAMLESMKKHVHNSLLQEHACGTIAAVALRQPQNATLLIQGQVQERLIAAIQQHAGRVTVQRQAALAIRNLAGRASPEEKEILQSTHNALVTIAGKHIGCQDEVFAALRDMGIDAKVLNIVQDTATGKMSVQEREHFGEGNNSNFRAEYDS